MAIKSKSKSAYIIRVNLTEKQRKLNYGDNTIKFHFDAYVLNDFDATFNLVADDNESIMLVDNDGSEKKNISFSISVSKSIGKYWATMCIRLKKSSSLPKNLGVKLIRNNRKPYASTFAIMTFSV